MKDLLNDLDAQIEAGQEQAKSAKGGAEKVAEARLKKFVLAKHKVDQNRAAALELEKEGRAVLLKEGKIETVTMFRDTKGQKRSFKVVSINKRQFDELVAKFRAEVMEEDQKLNAEYKAELVLMQQKKIPFTAEELIAEFEASKKG